MVINLTPSEEEIFSGFSWSARRHIRAAEKQLTSKVIDLSKEKNDDMFVLFYAFYKETANAKRLNIPMYRDMLPKLRAYKKKSFLLFAYEGKTPIAVIWMARHGSNMHYMQIGSVRRGYKIHADYLLLWEAIKESRKKGLKTFKLESIADQRFPPETPIPGNLAKTFAGADEEIFRQENNMFQRVLLTLLSSFK